MQIIGHRGAAGEAPENTLGGFRHALAHGVRHFELDLQLSADGVPLVIHDSDTLRTTGIDRSVRTSRFNQLSDLDAAATFPWGGTEPVPTLSDLLPVLQTCDSVQLEIKPDQPQRLSRLLQAMAFMLAAAAIDNERLHITSSDTRALEQARHWLPGSSRGLICECPFIDNLQLARQLDCQLLVYHYSLLTEQRIRSAKDAGLEVSTYTVNNELAIRRFTEWGIDSVITDFPIGFLALQSAPAPTQRPAA